MRKAEKYDTLILEKENGNVKKNHTF